MKTVINIFQAISIIIGIAVILIFLVPIIFGIKPFVVLSGSMEPKVKVGSIAYINTKVSAESINVGDIIAFNLGDKQVTHRVVKINDDNSFVTKGDANNSEDISPVKFENFKGKNIFSIPYLGRIIVFCQTFIGKFILFLLIGLNILCAIFEGSEEDDKKK